MSTYSRIDTLLSGLHYIDSDVRIEFGEAPADHAHIHSSLLAARCPGLDILAILPNDYGVRVLAVAFQDDTCILEPLTHASILSSNAACHRFHDSGLAPADWSTPRHDDEHRGMAARNQNLYAKRQYITILRILYEEPITLDDLEPYPSRDPALARLHSATTSVIETCARAAALGCLDRVARPLLALTFASGLLGQCVAQTPIKFLKLAIKVACKKLFFMATRHICADRKLSKNWFDASVYYNVNHDGLTRELALVLGQESHAAQQLLQALLDVQLCRSHMTASFTTASTPNSSFVHKVTMQSHCGECIARISFAEWLCERLDHCATGVSDIKQTETHAATETFRVVLDQLQHFATTLMPFQVFAASSNIHKTLAFEVGLSGELVVERKIKFYLDTCVREAAAAIKQALELSQTELTEENFPSLGSSPPSKQTAKTIRNVSAESDTTSSPAPLPTVSTRPSRASTRMTSIGSKTSVKLNPAAVNFTCENELDSSPTKDSTPLQTALRTADSYAKVQSAARVDSLSPPLRKASPSQDPSEHCLLTELLAELDDPSDTRWMAARAEYHQCCGAKKDARNARGHRCEAAKLVEIRWSSVVLVGVQDKSIW